MRILSILLLVIAVEAQPCAWPVSRSVLFKKTATYWEVEYVRLSRDFDNVSELLSSNYAAMLEEPRVPRGEVEARLTALVESQTEWPRYFLRYFLSDRVNPTYDATTAVQEALSLRMSLVIFMKSFNEELLATVPVDRTVEDAHDFEVQRAIDRAKAKLKIAPPHYLLWGRRQLQMAKTDHRFSYASRRLFYEMVDGFTRCSIFEHPSTSQIIMPYLGWGYCQSTHSTY